MTSCINAEKFYYAQLHNCNSLVFWLRSQEISKLNGNSSQKLPHIFYCFNINTTQEM
jgi:hypothetical protein